MTNNYIYLLMLYDTYSNYMGIGTYPIKNIIIDYVMMIFFRYYNADSDNDRYDSSYRYYNGDGYGN